MRICFISASYPTLPIFGGIAVYTRTAAQSLAARGHQVHVLVGRVGETGDFQDGAVHVHIRPVRWLPIVGRWLPGLGESASLARALRQLHRQYQFDIVEFPNWEGVGLVSMFCKIAPMVVRLYTSTADSLNIEHRQPSLGERFTLWLEKTSARLATVTITHSQSHCKNLGALYGLTKVHFFPLGIEMPAAPIPASTPACLAVLTVGPLNPRKGADTLLAAIPLVLQQIPEATFWLVGGDKEHRYERRFWETHPALPKTSVQFLGQITDHRLAELYSSCAVYASAAVYESFGLTFVEAMAYGKPVVGCAVSAMVELIQDGQTGLLVPPNDPQALADSIVRLLKDSDLRRRLGNQGRQTAVGRYSAERMAENIEQFFSEVIRQFGCQS